MTEKKPTDLKSVSLEQINALEGKTVVGGGSGAAAQSVGSKSAKDFIKLSEDPGIGLDKEPAGGGKERSETRKDMRDMKKLAKDAESGKTKR